MLTGSARWKNLCRRVDGRERGECASDVRARRAREVSSRGEAGGAAGIFAIVLSFSRRFQCTRDDFSTFTFDVDDVRRERCAKVRDGVFRRARGVDVGGNIFWRLRASFVIVAVRCFRLRALAKLVHRRERCGAFRLREAVSEHEIDDSIVAR